MNISYRSDIVPETDQIIQLYRSAGLNRPVHDSHRIRKMYENSNLIISAWHDDKLVGVARSLTDFCYCCYLSDLAVRKEYQHRGIGKEMISITKEKIGDQCMLLLLSAPDAMGYYPRLNFEKIANGFIIHRKA